MMDLETVLTGENLMFYKNIRYLRELTSHAKAVILRSHTKYQNILQSHVLKLEARGLDQEVNERESPEALLGNCVKCGLEHGTGGFCILEEIMKEESGLKSSPPKKSVLLKSFLGRKEKFEDESNELLFPLSAEEKKEWGDVLCRKMSPEELQHAYKKICVLHGDKSGQKFLYARSLAQGPEKFEEFYEGSTDWKAKADSSKANSKFDAIRNDCIFEKQHLLNPICPEYSSEVREKLAHVMEIEPPCTFVGVKTRKPWKNVFKGERKFVRSDPESEEDLTFLSHRSNEARSESSPVQCPCKVRRCDCDVKPTCSVPKKQCHLTSDYYNNYLRTIRENIGLRRRKGYKSNRATESISPSTKEARTVKKDSGLMLIKAQEAHKKYLRSCLGTLTGGDHGGIEFDQNVDKIAQKTYPFSKIDDLTWDHWADGYLAQEELEEYGDGGMSDDSDISSDYSNSSASSLTEQEWKLHKTRIPYAEETFKRVNVLFDRIYAKFKKSFLKSTVHSMFLPYKKIFFSHVDELTLLKDSSSAAASVFDLLNLHWCYLKSLKPATLRKTLRMKRLETKRKTISKKIKKRRYIEGIQCGKRFKRSQKSLLFSKDKEYVGFKPKERELLQKPTSGRFTSDLLGDECEDIFLSKERIHYQYRLLRTLFDGPVENNRENLMDEGMKERLEMFRAKLHSQSKLAAKSSQNVEAPGEWGAASYQRPLKSDERKQKSAAKSFVDVTCKKDFPVVLQRDDDTSSSSATSQSNVYRRGGSIHKKQTYEGSTYPRIISGRSGTKRSNSTAITEVPRGESINQWEDLHLPSPPLSDSSCDESDVSEHTHRVPEKEEAQMEKSARITARSAEDEERHMMVRRQPPPKPRLPFHVRPSSLELGDSELTDASSDSYLPNLLKVPSDRVGNIPASVRSYPHKQKTHFRMKNRNKFPLSSDSSSIDVSTTEGTSHDSHKERAAWNRKFALNEQTLLKGMNLLQQTESKASNREPAKRNYGFDRTAHLHSQQLTGEPQATNNVGTMKDPILKKSSLPKPPWDGRSENQQKVHQSAHQKSWSESSFPTTSGPSGRLVAPTRIVTERLLKASDEKSVNVDPTGSIKKMSSQSRATPESRVIPSPSKVEQQESLSVGFSISQKGRVEDNQKPKIESQVRSSVQTRRSGSEVPPSASTEVPKTDHSRQSILKQKPESIKFAPDTAQRSSGGSILPQLSARHSSSRSSRISKNMSELFRKRSVDVKKSTDHESISGYKPSKKPIVDPSLHSKSASSVNLKLKKLEAIGPTNKRVFELDIGQGINCVRYLKANAPGADEIKKKELVDLLTTPVQVKKEMKKATVTSVKKEASCEDSETLIRAMDSSTVSFSRHGSAVRTKPIDLTIGNDAPLKTMLNFKTLDEIYKEVHGINKLNTPAKYVENEYEFESKKKQQLTKHKIR